MPFLVVNSSTVNFVRFVETIKMSIAAFRELLAVTVRARKSRATLDYEGIYGVVREHPRELFVGILFGFSMSCRYHKFEEMDEEEIHIQVQQEASL